MRLLVIILSFVLKELEPSIIIPESSHSCIIQLLMVFSFELLIQIPLLNSERVHWLTVH